MIMTIKKHDKVSIATDECPTYSSRTRYVAVVTVERSTLQGRVVSSVRGTRQHSRRDLAMKEGLKIAKTLVDSITRGTYDEHVGNNADLNKGTTHEG